MILLLALAAAVALGLVAGVALGLLKDAKASRVSPHWRDAHYRERRDDDA